MYLLQYKIPSAYKESASDTATHYYTDFRWIGVSEIDPDEICGDSWLVLAGGDVAVGTGGIGVSLLKNGKPVAVGGTVSAEGIYTVSVKAAAYDLSKTSVKCEDEKSGVYTARFAIDRSEPVIHAFVNIRTDTDIQVKVMTEDLTGVTGLKWAKGTRDTEYFTEGGEDFCGDFSADAFGTYTIYAVDCLNHASVCVFEVNAAAKAMKPGVSKKFVPGYPNKLDISVKSRIIVKGSVSAEIYSKDGKWIASADSYGKDGNKASFAWDGKLDSGNELNSAAGSYAPVSSSGTSYKVMIAVRDSSKNTVYSTPQNVKLYSSLKIKSAAVSNAKFKAVKSGKNKAKIRFKLSMASDVVVKIYNSSMKKVYAVLKQKNAEAEKLLALNWNGKATAGNTARLKAGALVPKGIYRAVIYAAGKSKTVSTKLKVSR